MWLCQCNLIIFWTVLYYVNKLQNHKRKYPFQALHKKLILQDWKHRLCNWFAKTTKRKVFFFCIVIIILIYTLIINITMMLHVFYFPYIIALWNSFQVYSFTRSNLTFLKRKKKWRFVDINGLVQIYTETGNDV
jgi:hypothetical protein